jgi:hypothetical protein
MMRSDAIALALDLLRFYRHGGVLSLLHSAGERFAVAFLPDSL